MKRTTKYVALDVHQASTVSSMSEEGGRVIARTIVPTEASAIVEFFRGLRGTVHVTFEEGTQARWLHDLIAPLVASVIVCDRRGERRHGNKNDRSDADELSELLRRGGLRAVYHGNAHRSGVVSERAPINHRRILLRWKSRRRHLKLLKKLPGIHISGPGTLH